MVAVVCHFGFWNFPAFLSECEEATDCPKNGTNYICINNICDCLSGYILDGEDCVGMLNL